MFENGIYSWRKSNGKNLSVAIAGDVCPRDNAADAVLSGKSGEILREIQPVLDRADLRLVQWETVISEHWKPITKSGPNLLVPPGCEAFITAGRFEIALLANNHIGDHSPSGVLDTIRYIRNAGVRTVGAGCDAADAARPLHLEKNGLRISVLNFCEMEFGTAGKEIPGSNAMDEMDSLLQIGAERRENDIVLVVIHGGNEYNPIPSPRMRKLYSAFARAGASAVVNIHAHCPQGVELVENVPVVYCPGNFFFPSAPGVPFDPHHFWWSGYLPRISFDELGAYEIELTPYCFSPEPWKIEPLHGKQRQWFLNYVDLISSMLLSEGDYWFDLWCAYRCEAMLSWVKNSPAAALAENLSDHEALQKLPVIRHMFTCQAHYEVTRRMFLLIEQGKMQRLREELPELADLQRAKFADLM